MAFGASAGDRANNADGKIVIGTSVDMYGMNNGLAKIQKSVNRLGRAMRGAIGVVAFYRLGKAALDAASDLQEVQNIVDVAFGDMKYKAEQFASTSIEKFGMSELAAKQTAGSFMAMGKSMGLTMEEASDMAISLTGLTADFGSFYNMSQDYARVAMSAVYTGETETLKRYGIVLTEANLQQYAMTQGITTSVKAMDARSKALLRYNYIIQATADMQGDFERTSGSWANQTRLLKQQWTVFLTTLGNGLITILMPVLQVLNAIVQAMTRMLKIIGATLHNLFGINWKNMYQDVETTSESFGGAADGLEDMGNAAEKAGKQAKKSLAPWDDLNVLAQDTQSSLKGGSGGGGADGLSVDMDIPEYDGKGFEDWLHSFDSLFELGRYLADGLENTLRNIDWQHVYEGARTFGTGLAEFLNGLISPSMFGSVGMTIASALNTVVYTALSFGQEFDFTNWGNALAQGVNEFFQTFDFGALADAIDSWVQGIYNALKTFIHEVNWTDVLKGAFDFMKNLDIDTVSIIIDYLIIKSIGKILGTKLIAETIGKQLTAELAAGGGLAGIGEVISLTAGGAGTLAESITAVFGPAVTALATVGSILGGLALSVVNFFGMWEHGWDIVKSILEALGVALVAVGAVILGAPAAIAAVGAAVAFAISQVVILVHDHWEQIKAIFDGIGDWFKTTVIDPVVSFFTGMWENIKQLVATGVSNIKTLVAPIVEWIQTNVLTPIQVAIEWLGTVVENVWNIIQAVLIIVSTFVYDVVIAPVVNFFIAMFDSIKAKFDAIRTAIKVVLMTVSTFVYNRVIQPIVSHVTNFIDTVKNKLKAMWDHFKSRLTLMVIWIRMNVTEPITNFFNKVWDGISNGARMALNIAISLVEHFINGIINMINSFTAGLSVVSKLASKVTGNDVPPIAQIPHVNLPRLATGAVIPPNKEFMAILGDQKSGTNIEAPLDTIVQAMQQALETMQVGNRGPQTVNLEIDGVTLARLTLPYNLDELHRSGYNVNVLEG